MISERNNLKPQAGFTLIELIVVFSVISIISAIGVAGFSEYNQAQVLQSSVSEFVSALNLAKSRALSQVKGPCTDLQSLDGYNVEISVASNTYELKAKCSGGLVSVYTKPKTLPKNITFRTGSSESFFFPVLEGGVSAAGQVIIEGYGQTKTIAVNTLGGISIQ